MEEKEDQFYEETRDCLKRIKQLLAEGNREQAAPCARAALEAAQLCGDERLLFRASATYALFALDLADPDLEGLADRLRDSMDRLYHADPAVFSSEWPWVERTAREYHSSS